jgi:hypothetical protein
MRRSFHFYLFSKDIPWISLSASKAKVLAIKDSLHPTDDMYLNSHYTWEYMNKLIPSYGGEIKKILIEHPLLARPRWFIFSERGKWYAVATIKKMRTGYIIKGRL